MSVTSSEKRAHRTPSLLVAAIPAVTLIVLLGGGYIAASLPVEPLLIASAVVAGIVAMTLGYTWDEIMARSPRRSRRPCRLFSSSSSSAP